VLADEPDASLDPKTGDEVMQLLHALCKESGRTLVFVSHRMEHAVRYPDRIVGLAAGRIALDVAADKAEITSLRAFFAPETPVAAA
jgi:phosphonate transport system ATP-binding protein